MAWNVCDLLLRPSSPLIHLAQLLLNSLKWFNAPLFALWTHRLISSVLVFFSPSPSSFSCLNSAHRELKVCWSRLLAPRSYPLRAHRGNLRQLVPAQTTAPQWALTPHRSSPLTVGAATLLPPKAMPLRSDTPRVDQRKANVRLCIFPTLPLTTLFPILLWNLPPAPRTVATKGPSSPLCTDWPEWREKAHIVCSSHAETQSHTSSLISKRPLLFAGSLKVPGQVIMWGWQSQICVSVWSSYSESRRGLLWPWMNEKHMKRWDVQDGETGRCQVHQVLWNSGFDVSASFKHFES